jgi:hypothetical protein
VLLKEVLEDAGVDTAGKDTVIMKAVDGYTSAIGMEETLQDDNVYLVFQDRRRAAGYEGGGRQRAAAGYYWPRTPSARDGANL